MKKLISGISALTMLTAMAVPFSAFAEDVTSINQGSASKSGTMTATYDVQAKYTVTIPAGVDLKSDASVSGNITASDVMLESGKKIVVKLTDGTNTHEGSTFNAKTEKGDSTATYTIGKGTATTGVKVGDTVAEFTADGSQVLSFSAPTGATYAGTHTETLTFGISVEDAIKVVDLSTISGEYYDVTENVILTGTPNEDSFTIRYRNNNNYEVTLDNVNSAGNKTVFVNGEGHNMNIKLKGTSKLSMLGTSGTLTIDEAEAGGTVILVSDSYFLSGSPVTINGGTVKAKGTEGSPVYGSLTVNGGAVYLAADENFDYAVDGSITAGSGVTLYGWNGSAWTTNTNVQYVTTDNTSGTPENWNW